MIREQRQGTRPMTERIFDRLTEFRERRRISFRHEQRIVTKTATASRLQLNPSFTGAGKMERRHRECRGR